MKHLAVLSAALVLMSASAFAQSIYANARYDYSISYPSSLLKQQPESASGDGVVFSAIKGKAEFRVYANAMVEDINDTPALIAKSAEEDCPGHHATYRVVKPKLVAISCTAGANILYSKTLMNGDVATTFEGTYPAAERAIWDPAAAAMARSLTAGHFLN
jgi:hypothetical protein